MPLTAVRGIRLAGAPSRIRTARECLEELGLSGYMLESLYKITYDRPHTFHLDAGNGATHKSDSYIASVHGGLKIFFMLIAGRSSAGNLPRRRRGHGNAPLPKNEISRATRYRTAGESNEKSTVDFRYPDHTNIQKATGNTCRF